MIKNVPVTEDLSRKNVGNENGEIRRIANRRKTVKSTDPIRTKNLLKMTKRNDVPTTRQTENRNPLRSNQNHPKNPIKVTTNQAAETRGRTTATNTKASLVTGRKVAEAVEIDPQNERRSPRNGVNDLLLVTGMKETEIEVDAMAIEIETGIDAAMKVGDLIWEDLRRPIILAPAPTAHLDLAALLCRHMSLQEIMVLQISRKEDILVAHRLEDLHHQVTLMIDVIETAVVIGPGDKQKCHAIKNYVNAINIIQ
jgi:hypothetical protein